MLKLIRLEWKKNNVGKYIRNVVIMSALICLFIFALCYLGIANDPDTGVPDAAPGNSAISSSIELFTSMAFLVFTSVMLSTYIVSAYKNKTMNLMFAYPIKRQKILVSQMLAVWIFNFVARADKTIDLRLHFTWCTIHGFLIPTGLQHGKYGVLYSVTLKVRCHCNHEFYRLVYWYGYEVLKSYHRIIFSADFFDTG